MQSTKEGSTRKRRSDAGKPRKPGSSQPRTQLVSLRVTEELEQQIYAAADAIGVSRSDLLFELVRKGVSGLPEGATMTIRFDGEVMAQAVSTGAKPEPETET